jgi:hypothetical protein
MLLFKKNSRGKKIKILISSKEKKILFLEPFLKGKSKHASITKFNPTSNEKKLSFIYFLFTI